VYSRRPEAASLWLHIIERKHKGKHEANREHDGMLPVFSVPRSLLSVVKPSCLTQLLRFVPVKKTRTPLRVFSQTRVGRLINFCKLF